MTGNCQKLGQGPLSPEAVFFLNQQWPLNFFGSPYHTAWFKTFSSKIFKQKCLRVAFGDPGNIFLVPVQEMKADGEQVTSSGSLLVMHVLPAQKAGLMSREACTRLDSPTQSHLRAHSWGAVSSVTVFPCVSDFLVLNRGVERIFYMPWCLVLGDAWTTVSLRRHSKFVIDDERSTTRGSRHSYHSWTVQINLALVLPGDLNCLFKLRERFISLQFVIGWTLFMRFLLSEMFIIKGVIQVQDFHVYNTLPCNKSWFWSAFLLTYLFWQEYTDILTYTLYHFWK